MEVSIYIYISHKGNPRGAGDAIALLEFIDSKGTAHTRITRAAGNDCTKNSATMEMLEKIEAVYDKYNGSSTRKGFFK